MKKIVHAWDFIYKDTLLHRGACELCYVWAMQANQIGELELFEGVNMNGKLIIDLTQKTIGSGTGYRVLPPLVLNPSYPIPLEKGLYAAFSSMNFAFILYRYIDARIL